MKKSLEVCGLWVKQIPICLLIPDNQTPASFAVLGSERLAMDALGLDDRPARLSFRNERALTALCH
jgi:hypothetical protein